MPVLDIRPITPDYAVAPQIEPADMAAIRAAGFTTVINNRPDGEIPPHLRNDRMRAAAEAAGLAFVFIPLLHSHLADAVPAQADAMAASAGPVLAYCATGNRCAAVWALSQAGKRPAEELVGMTARHGYRLSHLLPQIEALARG
jgi:uncharacterized protein (TIGR01244 family)